MNQKITPSFYRFAPRFTVMQILTVSGLVCMIVFGLVDALFATDGGHKHRVRHYEKSSPQTPELARDQFHKDMRQIQKILAQSNMGAPQLEAIHETTYSMESSLKTLSTTWGAKPLFADVVASLELLHKASEDHHEQETRAHFAALLEKSTKLFAPTN
ncbi:MAG: hypothetical protein EAY65_01645 [Alphaproteobacteria bacterium]|nr:MAG: hypothetical protein EAY65_01645 [Alphaproteobacteria bacterium]